MTNCIAFAAVAAALALAACDNKPTPPAGSTDPNSANFAAPKAAKNELPPMPKSSKSYRCDDQSVVAIQLFQGDKQANVTIEKGVPTVLKADEAGKPFVAEGFELTVAGNAIMLTRPGHPKQKCTS